jgi:hypothetical protein
LFLSILKAGVEIVTMVPERRYSKASVGDLVGLLEPLIVMTRAHDESLVKSQRLSEVWKQRRKHAAQKPMNGVGPAWLRLVDGKWQVIEERADVVRLIFRLAINGFGIQAIAHQLNREKVPPIGRGKEWVYSYVWLTLRNRAVLGEFQPHVVNGKRTPTGKAIPGYYPPIISESEFYKASEALTARQQQRGPRGQHVRNLFTGLLRDAKDGCTLVTVSESDKCKSVRLVSSGGLRGRAGSSYRTFPYLAVEEAFLELVKELKASDVLPAERGDAPDEVAIWSGRLQELEHRISKTMSDMKEHGEFEIGLRLLRDLEAEKTDVAARLEKAKAAAVTSEAEVLGETQSLAALLEKAEGEERLSLRLKIKARIAALVSEMRMLIVPRGWNRIAALQVWFAKSSKRRDLLIVYRGGRQGGSWEACSLADVREPGDLRDRRQAKELERLLSKVDLKVSDAEA